MKTLTTLITILTLSQFSISALAYNSQTEAGITGAFCECNEPDAYPGVSLNFTREQLNEIQEKFVTVDPRRPINRLSKRFKQLNVTGKVDVLDKIDGKVTVVGFGNGILLPGNLVLTNAHVIGGVGTYVRFNIGQTDPRSPNRFADSVLGKVITLGSSIGSIPEDWALVVLDDREVNLNEKYGSAKYKKMSKEEFIEAGKKGELWTAGFAGFKDPRSLWGQNQIKLSQESDQIKNVEPSKINAASSSGMSSGGLWHEYEPGQFYLVGLIRGGEAGETVGLSIDKFGFNKDITRYVNFKDPLFSRNFESDYKKILDGSF